MASPTPPPKQEPMMSAMVVWGAFSIAANRFLRPWNWSSCILIEFVVMAPPVLRSIPVQKNFPRADKIMQCTVASDARLVRRLVIEKTMEDVSALPFLGQQRVILMFAPDRSTWCACASSMMLQLYRVELRSQLCERNSSIISLSKSLRI